MEPTRELVLYLIIKRNSQTEQDVKFTLKSTFCAYAAANEQLEIDNISISAFRETSINSTPMYSIQAVLQISPADYQQYNMTKQKIEKSLRGLFEGRFDACTVV